MKQVKARTGVDIGRFLDNEFAGYIAVLSDPVIFMDVLFVLVSEQAEKRGVSDEQFGRSLGGDAGEAAVAAFREAFESFCPSRQRKLLRAMAANGTKIVNKRTEVALKRIESRTERVLKKLEARAAAVPTSSPSATSAPESSESIPAG